MENEASSAAVDEQLFRAVKEGDLDEIRTLVLADASVQSVNPVTAYKLIQEATRFGHLHVVEWLLGDGLDVDTIDLNGYTPLHVASYYGQLEMVEFLVNKNADVHAKTRYFEEPIHLATESGHRDVIEYFLNNGNHVDDPSYRQCTPLHIAAGLGNLKVVKLLLDHHANIHVRNDFGEKPIYIAVKFGHRYVVEVLLDNGNDVDEIGRDNCTLLIYAVQQDHLDVAQLLIDKGANVHALLIWGETLLCWAVTHGHSEFVQLLIDTGVNVHAANVVGSKPIHLAVLYRRTNIIEILLSNGNGVEETDGEGYTLLCLAAMENNLEIAQFLLDKGANVHTRVLVGPDRNDGATQKAIHAAAECGQTDMVAFLLNNGNDVDEINVEGWTPLHYAMWLGRMDLVRFLISKHADVHAITIDGQKPIHQAAFHGHSEIVELFRNIGVNVNCIDKHGQSLLHLASMQGRLEVVQLLIKYANNNVDIDFAPLAPPQDDTIVVKDALSRESVINAQDKEGCTPLHLAFQCFRPKVQVVQCLLEAGARFDVKDHCGNTAMFYLIQVKSLEDISSDRSLCMVPEVLQKINLFDINDVKASAAHVVFRTCFLPIELVKLVLQHQNNLNVKDFNGRTPLNYLTEPYHVASIDKRSELIRLVINHGVYFNELDCRNIIANPVLKKNLFTDVKLCTQSVLNKFDNKDLPKVYKIISSVSELPPLDQMKINNTQVKTIELALKEQINDKGYCDVSRKMLVPLAMLCVEAYVSHYERMQHV